MIALVLGAADRCVSSLGSVGLIPPQTDPTDRSIVLDAERSRPAGLRPGHADDAGPPLSCRDVGAWVDGAHGVLHVGDGGERHRVQYGLDLRSLSDYMRPHASDRHYLQMGRAATVAGILLSIATAYVAASFNDIMDFLQLVFAFVNAPLFATFMLGMSWKRTTGHGAFTGLFAGTLAAAVHHGFSRPSSARQSASKAAISERSGPTRASSHSPSGRPSWRGLHASWSRSSSVP